MTRFVVNQAFILCSLGLCASAQAYEGVDGFAGVSVSGRVTLRDPPAPLPATPVPEHHAACGKSRPNLAYLKSADGGLANVVVSLVGIERGKPLDKGKAVLENKDCEFVPRVSALALGTKLTILNSDGMPHSAHAKLAGKTQFNVALPARDLKARKKLKRPGVLELSCDAGHTWMRGWIHVVEHPYVAVTDASGGFTLSDVPAGKYTLHLWHEAAGEQRRPIEVRPEVGAKVEITY